MKFFGDRKFLKNVAVITLPIVIQNTISNFVGLLDNLMVGRCGTDSMNGVSIFSQLFFVFILCVWGSSCGAGIFTAQFFGKGDHKGVRDTFRIKLYLVGIATIAGAAVFLLFGEYFMEKFIHESDSVGDPVATMRHAKDYMMIMLIGMIPTALGMVYAGTLRDIGETSVPMKAGFVAVFVNLILNYLLIFGKFGFPELGVKGAAIATVVSRFVESGIEIVWTHTHKEKCRFIDGAFASFKVPVSLVKKIVIKGIPLAANETLWSLGLTMLNQSFSLRGLAVVAAINITNTMANLFNVFLFAIGESISILAGQLLGAGKNEEAKSTANRMIALSFVVSAVIGGVLVLFKDLFPAFYNTENEVKNFAANFIMQTGVFLPVLAVVHGCYFTLRSGGKTFITFLFDSVFVWVFIVPAAFVLTRYTAMGIIMIYLIVKCLDLIKCAIGIVLVRKGVWVNNIVSN
ncbi:MAG: MATE family efflux transporter [Spirochaetia bacterium]|uniref:MATE family efflux transporter n=1 Tax=Treponema sp. TaxID=166 RepID=UPI00298D6DFD|nr:MATE family efflux transporter [Treponema sp.]MCI7577046.1 MATE family efflux transporter [Spirochaetia bacterium]